MQKRGYFSAGRATLSFQYGSVWQEGPLKPPHNVPVHHCVQLRRPEEAAQISAVVTAEPERTQEEASDARQNPAAEGGASSSSPQLEQNSVAQSMPSLSHPPARKPKQWIHHYMWEQNGTWFSCASLEELEVWGHTCVTEWIEGWQPNALTNS